MPYHTFGNTFEDLKTFFPKRKRSTRPFLFIRGGVIMTNMRIAALITAGLFAISTVIWIGSCGGAPLTEVASTSESAIRIVVWNAQALFDGTADGGEYDDYAEEAGWTEGKYRARLTSIAQAFEAFEAPPDVFALVEAENAEVLEMLSREYLAKYGYHWTFFGNNENAALGLGFLSRYPLEETRVHSRTNSDEVIPRPVLEARITVQEHPVVLFLCHWKSKLGGEKETEPIRCSAARIIARRVSELRREYPDNCPPIAVMGDLNENHDEFFRQGGAYLTALLPDDDGAAALAEQTLGTDAVDDFLVISGRKPPVALHFPDEAAVFYSTWAEEPSSGSYYYQGEWETIDHVLLDGRFFDKKGWEFSSWRTIRKEPFAGADGFPRAYKPRTGNGLSDHLPLELTLSLTPETAQ